MSSAVECLRDHLQAHYSADGWDVSGASEAQNRVWVNLPPRTEGLTDALVEIWDLTGATCDHNLTAEGATLTFLCPKEGWVASAEPLPMQPMRWGVVVVATVLASIGPLVSRIFSNATENSTAEGGGGEESEWFSFY
ncbi:MAG: hypothetical protein ACPGR8_15460 [Limisphaerales bacterium]